EMRDGAGRLLKRWRNGSAGLPATLEDHAFVAWGLLELYGATFDARWLAECLDMVDAMIAHHADEEHGGFFMTPHDGEPLLVRAKDAYDGAIPSGNAVAALVLARLARMTGNEDFERRA